jgi:hypothetical protein
MATTRMWAMAMKQYMDKLYIASLYKQLKEEQLEFGEQTQLSHRRVNGFVPI